jgi:hypothetical protein
MTFAFASLVFLAAAWLSIVVLAGTFEEYAGKVRAALVGAPPAPVVAISLQMRHRYPTRRAIRTRARPELRAAA